YRRWKNFCPSPARIVVSPMSTLELRARKSEEPLEVKRKPGEVASRAPMHGKPICDGRPIPSTLATACHWRRGSRLICKRFGNPSQYTYFYHSTNLVCPEKNIALSC